jgi:hypothetical protein
VVNELRRAGALRDHTFDYYDRRCIIDTQTDLSTLAREVGDVVTIEHALVPGGSMRCEIVKQEIDVDQVPAEGDVRGVDAGSAPSARMASAIRPRTW